MKRTLLIICLFIGLSGYSQLFVESFTDGNFTASPTWVTNTASNWEVVADAQAGPLSPPGTNTLRLGESVSGVSYLSTPISFWGSRQGWGIWWGRETPLDINNAQYFWLYSDKEDINDPSVNGYRLALMAGPIPGDPDLVQFQKIQGGVVMEVLTEVYLSAAGISDFGFLMRVVRQTTNEWTIFMNVDPAGISDGGGNMADESPYGITGYSFSALEISPAIPITGLGYIVLQTNSTKSPVFGHSGNPEFDQVYFEPNGGLPVTLESFKAVQQTQGVARLQWKVGPESNVEGYAIERSANGVAFSPIGFVQAKGVTNYSFDDQQILPGRNFYRLKTVDIDHTFKYSHIVTIDGESIKGLRIFPNPAQDRLIIQHPAASSTATIKLFSYQGRALHSGRLLENSVQTQLNISTLSPGIYFISYTDSKGEVVTGKFVKQ